MYVDIHTVKCGFLIRMLAIAKKILQRVIQSYAGLTIIWLAAGFIFLWSLARSWAQSSSNRLSRGELILFLLSSKIVHEFEYISMCVVSFV